MGESMTTDKQRLVELADQCQANADGWFDRACDSNRYFVEPSAAEALDTAIVWQNRAAALRALAQGPQS